MSPTVTDQLIWRDEVQRAHDLLERVIHDDLLRCLPSGTGALVAHWYQMLCWVLGERQGADVGEWLARMDALVREVDLLIESVEEVMNGRHND